MIRPLLVLVSFFTLFISSAQNKDSITKITYSAYAEMYGGIDFFNSSVKERPPFVCNHRRNNDLSINLMLVKMDINKKRLRSSLALMTGDYATFNLAHEPAWAKLINESTFGFKLSSKNDIWFDVGVFPSHIGFESSISKNCWTLTRSILAENSPYYESGAKLTYVSFNRKWQTTFLLLNGWQRISLPTKEFYPSFGFQLNFKRNNRFNLNYSNFIGKMKNTFGSSIRTYHNVYLQYEPNSNNGLTIGFDVGTDQDSSLHNAIWYSPVMIYRYSLNDLFSLAIRGEYYRDPKQVMVKMNSPNDFSLLGYSLNMDFQINKYLAFRIEGKIYHSKDKLFYSIHNENFFITTNMTISL